MQGPLFLRLLEIRIPLFLHQNFYDLAHKSPVEIPSGIIFFYQSRIQEAVLFHILFIEFFADQNQVSFFRIGSQIVRRGQAAGCKLIAISAGVAAAVI